MVDELLQADFLNSDSVMRMLQKGLNLMGLVHKFEMGIKAKCESNNNIPEVSGTEMGWEKISYFQERSFMSYLSVGFAGSNLMYDLLYGVRVFRRESKSKSSREGKEQRVTVTDCVFC